MAAGVSSQGRPAAAWLHEASVVMPAGAPIAPRPQVRGLYRGLSPPLIGGAAETGVNYLVSLGGRAAVVLPPVHSTPRQRSTRRGSSGASPHTVGASVKQNPL